MKLSKLSLRLIGTHAIMSIVQFVLMLPLLAILQENELYQWGIGLLFIAIFWLIIYADMSQNGQEDTQLDSYNPTKGFLAGLIAAIPGIILYFATLIYRGDLNWFNIILRVWLSPYIKIFTSFEGQMPHPAIIVNMLLPIISGISYLDGPRRRQKVLDAIERSNKMKTEKSKIGYKK